jgi:hypothetical protein
VNCADAKALDPLDKRGLGEAGRACMAAPNVIAFAMTKTHAQILELLQTLDPAEKRELAERATAVGGSFYARMTPEQRAELAESIAEADCGEGEDATSFFERMARKHGYSRLA